MHFRAVVAVFAAVSLSAALAAAPAAAALDPDRLAGLRARSIGPAGMSGRVAAIDAVEADPDIVYVGAATGGVWKSIDGGLIWKPIFDDQPVAAIGALAIFQPEPGDRLGRHRRRQRPQQRLDRRRRLQVGRRRHDLEARRAREERADPPHRAPSERPGRRLGRRPRAALERRRRARRLQDRRRRQELAQGPLRRREDRRGGRRDRSDEPEPAVRLDLAVPAPPVDVPLGRTGLRSLAVATTAARPGSGWRRRTACPKGELGRIGLAIARSNPSVVYAMVEAKKSALLRSDDGGRTLQERQREARRQSRGRSTSARSASTRRPRTGSTASTTRSGCRPTAARASRRCRATGTRSTATTTRCGSIRPIPTTSTSATTAAWR